MEPTRNYHLLRGVLLNASRRLFLTPTNNPSQNYKKKKINASYVVSIWIKNKDKQQPLFQENIHEILEFVLKKKMKELEHKQTERLQQIVETLTNHSLLLLSSFRVLNHPLLTHNPNPLNRNIFFIC